jgi:2-methylisocitrate lyase-like PEP mutase family enzyme
MKTLTVKEVEYGFGRLIDLARAEPVAKYERRVVVGLAVEDFERPKACSVIHSSDTGQC